jgi:diguanylate cyclase (GGDEF)-like protein
MTRCDDILTVATPERQGSLVLVIDDVALIRTMVKQSLADSGFTVAEAESGEEGLQRAEELRPDLILLDVILPDRDGFAVCRSLRAKTWGHQLPIVMITGLDDMDSIQQAFDAGATDFITKPITWGILGHRLSYIIRASRAEEKIRSLAYFDPLTGLPNRIHFTEHLAMQLAAARRRRDRLSILILDLDRFKQVNETLGHAAGDRLLQEVALRLRSALRQNDSVNRLADDLLPPVSRLGGDEFAVTLADTGQIGEVVTVAQRLLKQIAPPIVLDGYEFFPSVSIGISIFPDDGGDVAELLKNADTAMYHAKNEGRNNFQFYAPEMNATAMERLLLESEIRRAMAHQEFSLHYQPQVETATGNIVGLEALIRWNSPDRGNIPPDRFIPVAEETSLIFAIDEWVLRSACLQIREWDQAGVPPVRVAVNLSGQHFTRRTLLPLLDRIMEECGVRGERLELEITEGALMKEGAETMETLEGLRARGIAVSVDDFGTGYSSLSYLRRFPIDTLKIDRSFILDAPENPDSIAIATAIIALGQSLNLQVIAEGVETNGQRDFLANRGCPLSQGNLFSPPLPVDRLVPLLMAGTIQP